MADNGDRAAAEAAAAASAPDPNTVEIRIRLNTRTHQAEIQMPPVGRWILYGMLDMAREAIVRNGMKGEMQEGRIVRPFGG